MSTMIRGSVVQKKIPAMGDSVNAVLDAMHDLSTREAGLSVVEAVLVMSNKGPQVRYRWLGDGLNVVVADLGTFRPDGAVATRKARDDEYTELEEGLASGGVQINYRHRITREEKTIHQATGQSLPMDSPEQAPLSKTNDLEQFRCP